jgi:hypothetical protein
MIHPPHCNICLLAGFCVVFHKLFFLQYSTERMQFPIAIHSRIMTENTGGVAPWSRKIIR